MIEIERKFLVTSADYRNMAQHSHGISQGFLNTDPERTVRIRIQSDKGFLTIKGKSNLSGTTRYEWECELPLSEAESLMELCGKGVIEKVRYIVPYGKHIFEIDEFLGANQGLVIAEVELQNENEAFEKPDWLGQEVTGNIRYYNSYLINNPFNLWKP
ncbi:MAG: CYTH domain-containing protein [Flavobacteriaceae bacterium]